jgi:hypothetical protein
LHFQTTKNARAAWCIKQHKVLGFLYIREFQTESH